MDGHEHELQALHTAIETPRSTELSKQLTGAMGGSGDKIFVNKGEWERI